MESFHLKEEHLTKILKSLGYNFDPKDVHKFVLECKTHKDSPCTYKFTLKRGPERISLYFDDTGFVGNFYIEEYFYHDEGRCFMTRTTIFVSGTQTKVMKSNTWEAAEKKDWTPDYDLIRYW